MLNIVEEQVGAIREQVGDGRAICGLSGGVDSAVAAALVQRAIGDRLTCVFVDHGLLRKGEAEQVEQDFVAATGVKLKVATEAEAFLAALAGVTDPEQKRKIIGREFIRAFERAAREITAEAGEHGEACEFLVQGTLYPDVVESGGGTGTANIKSHHNVGGLPDDLKFQLVEPLRALFKDEVRRVGEELGLPPAIVRRQPFPGPGLAIRIIGEVTAERLEVLREADAIAREELSAAGLDTLIWQCPVVLLADVRSVGVQGDGRTYGHPVVLRPVTSEDAMTADWARLPDDVLARISTRITNEVPEVNRVVLDVTSKPPGHHRVGIEKSALFPLIRHKWPYLMDSLHSQIIPLPLVGCGPLPGLRPGSLVLLCAALALVAVGWWPPSASGRADHRRRDRPAGPDIDAAYAAGQRPC